MLDRQIPSSRGHEEHEGHESFLIMYFVIVVFFVSS